VRVASAPRSRIPSALAPLREASEPGLPFLEVSAAARSFGNLRAVNSVNLTVDACRSPR